MILSIVLVAISREYYFGSICENLSNTPLVPKSGEHELHTAPMELVASMATTASGTFGRKPTTRHLFELPTLLDSVRSFLLPEKVQDTLIL